MYILIFLDSKTYQLISKFLYMKPNNKAFPMKTCEKKASFFPFQYFIPTLCHQPQSLHVYIPFVSQCIRCSHVILGLPQDTCNNVLFGLIVPGKEGTHTPCQSILLQLYLLCSVSKILSVLSLNTYQRCLFLSIQNTFALMFRFPSFNGSLLLAG